MHMTHCLAVRYKYKIDMTDQYAIITVTLPVCLHLDDREFSIPYQKDSYIIITSNDFFSNEFTYLGAAQNAEVSSDSFSHFRFSRITMKIPVFDSAPVDPIKILKDNQKVFFKHLNLFIDAVRYSLGRDGLRNYYDYSDFIEGANAASSKPDKIRMLISVSFPGDGICGSKPLRTNEEHKKLQQILEKSIDLPDMFLLDAKRDLYYKSYIYALLNAVIALEIIVADTIRVIAKSKNINEEEINSFIRDVGLTGNIKSTLKLLTTDQTTLPEDVVFVKCKTSITLRNKIMHRGLRDIPESEIPSYIANIEKMIAFCESLEQEYK